MSKKPNKYVWHTLSKKDCFSILDTTNLGLSQDEALARLEAFGPNSIPSPKVDSWGKLILRQFKSPLVYTLLLVTIITFVLGEITDGSIIATVLVFNAFIGALQEGKAQSSILALRAYSNETALVRRSGKEFFISVEELVPGDLIIVLEGNKVPADARIVKEEGLFTNEAILTGESNTKPKTTETLKGVGILPSERNNMLFKGTHISRGKAEALVVNTGTSTEIGRISLQTALYETEIPLQKKIRTLTNKLILVIGVVLVALFLISLAQGYPAQEIFLTTASLLVAVMPEGLPIVITLVLAQGVQRMAKSNVLVKRLQAVEALGNAEVIAVDKTGTLTKNELSVVRIYLPEITAKIKGSGYEKEGQIDIVHYPEKELDKSRESLQNFGEMSILSANATIFRQEENTTTIAGDPTEAAMLVFGERTGFKKEDLILKKPLLDEISFSYKTKYYANLHQTKETNLLLVTGAPEVVLGCCSKINKLSKIENLLVDVKNEFLLLIQKESQQGKRAIALASKKVAKNVITEKDISELVFEGIFVMEDQIRKEVSQAVRSTKEAGIKVVMITGDYPSTAENIATEAGIYQPGDRVMSGPEIEKMTDKELRQSIPTVSVFARVTPEHKLRIIRSFKDAGKTIAMTGDGVNDVPSLVAADLGVAMGTGTKAAQAAGDIVLLDDNFGNVTKATKEGKRIFQSIKKVISFLLSTNTGELLVIGYSIIGGLTIPLNPAQIIWLNLLTDSFLVFPLTTEKNTVDNKKEQSTKLLGSFGIIRIIVVAIATLTAFLIIRKFYPNTSQELLSTITLMTFVFGQIWVALSLRNKKTWKGIIENKWFWLAVLTVIIIQIIGVYFEPVRSILRTAPLSEKDWLFAIVTSLIIPLMDVIYVMIYKILRVKNSFHF